MSAKHNNEEEPHDLKTEIKKDIQHHLQDSHDFHIVSNKDHSFNLSFPLPIILWDDGLKIFSSSEFHHGEEVASVDGTYYKLYHGKIYKTDASGTISIGEHGHPENAKPLDFSITKNVLSIFLIGVLLVFIFGRYASSYKKNNGIPSKGGKFLEPLVLFIRDEIAIPNIGEKHYRKYMGYLLTIFFFIWIVNLFGLTPLGLNITGNIAITFALALMTFVITQVTAKGEYWKHIFWMPGVPVPMKFVLAPIELLGVFIKPFALMIRLYANISAGHIVIMSLIALLWFFNYAAGTAFVGLTFFLSIIELLVAFLQAYIFTMLTALYFGTAVAGHDDH